MRVKAYITFKGKFELTYIGRVGKNGVFKFRNKQLRKACLNTLKDTLSYNCWGGSIRIPDISRAVVKQIFDDDKYITCYTNVACREVTKRDVVTYYK